MEAKIEALSKVLELSDKIFNSSISPKLTGYWVDYSKTDTLEEFRLEFTKRSKKKYNHVFRKNQNS